jgi:hypothetical protein
LKGDSFFVIHFRLLAFENGSKGEQFCEDAPYGPEVDRRGVVFASEEEFRGAVPDGYDDFVAAVEAGEWFVEESGETEIPDSNFAAGGYHDICRLEISVEYPVGVKVLQAIEELE